MLSITSRRTLVKFAKSSPRSWEAPVSIYCFTQSSRAMTWNLSACINRIGISFSSIYPSRTFATTSIHWKKSAGRKKYEEESEENPRIDKRDGPTMNSTTTPLTDIINLTPLKAEIGQILEKLKTGLGGLKPGGRFNPNLIETLRVDISKLKSNNEAADTQGAGASDPSHQESTTAGKKQKSAMPKHKHAATKPTSTTAALKDMAQVIPRGAKTVLVMLNEAAFAKPVMSALLGSQFSLNPSVSASNSLELVVPIPPPSAELRAQTLHQVDRLKDKADFAVRDSRADMQKELRALHLSNQIRPDDYHDIQKKMEKFVEEAKIDVKRMCDASRKALQQS